MDLVARVAADLLEAMKERHEKKVSVLRMLKAAFQKAQADKGRAEALTEEEAVALVRRLLKQRKEAAEQYEAAGVPDRAEEELSDLPFLERYLPEPLNDVELGAHILKAMAISGAVSSKDLGKLMKVLMPMVEGRADGKRVRDKAAGLLASLQTSR